MFSPIAALRTPQTFRRPARAMCRVLAGRASLREDAWLLAVVCAGLVQTSGCVAEGAFRPPRAVLHEYAEAMAQGRTQHAYQLLTPRAQAQLPYAEFKRLVVQNPQELAHLTAHLLQPDARTEITAEIQGPTGQTLHLVYEGSGWKIEASALDLYAQYNPEVTIASFLRAYENGRYDVLLQFVPSPQRGDLTEEQLRQAWQGEQKAQMQRITQALAASLPRLEVEIIGPRATVGYGAGATVELVLEDGLWKIEDI